MIDLQTWFSSLEGLGPLRLFLYPVYLFLLFVGPLFGLL